MARLPKENRGLRTKRSALSSRSLLRLGKCPPEVIILFMDANKAGFPIKFMIDCLEVSTSGFYEWMHRQSNPWRLAGRMPS